MDAFAGTGGIPAAGQTARNRHGPRGRVLFQTHDAAVRRVYVRQNKPQEIRLADFLRQEDQVFWDTARHEYAHAAVALLTGKRHGHDEAWKAVCRKIGCPPERLAPNCNAAVENRKRIEAVRGVYVVTCLGCGTQSRYLRRGTVVQALEEQRGGIRCRRCGGKKFRLEKRFEPQEEYT